MRISILGTGNLSSHLSSGFYTQGVDIVQVYGRRIDAAREIALPIKAEGIDSMFKLRSDVDLVLVAVSDSAIEQVLSEIPNQRDFKMIAHTAGCVSATPIPMLCPNGVFYPLQTFSKDRVIDWSTVPIFLTSERNADLKILDKAANLLSKQVSVINDQERLVLHLCATLVNNFSNHLFALSEKIATESEINFEVMKPLILETASKVMSMDPDLAQTGPAKRGDIETMDKHLKLLKNRPEIMQIYQVISKSIMTSGKAE